MRPRRRSSLPRFARPGHDDNGEASSVRFQWHRRYTYYLALFLFLTWFLYPRHKPASDKNAIDWSNYAYSLYATDGATLCHAVMIFDALARYGSKADRVLFYPKSWDTVVSSSKDRDSQLLVLARDRYKVKLQPVKLLAAMGRTKDAWTGTWDNSVTKFMAWSLAYYERVIALDSDMTLLQSLDELFLLPQTPIAMPRAYWCETKPCPLTSMLMVIKPDLTEFERFKDTITGGGNDMLVNAHRFDMEIINERFEHSAMVLPHRPYGLLSGEFRSKDHSAYLGNTHENWDAAQVLKEAKLVHFSDWPLPKPWVMWPFEGLQEMQPDCGGSHEGSCPERRIWKGLYEDFRERRKDICKLLSVPAPDWGVITGSRKHVLNGTVADSSSDRGSGPAVGEREAVPPSPSLSLASPAPETLRDVPAAAGARAAAAEEAEA